MLISTSSWLIQCELVMKPSSTFNGDKRETGSPKEKYKSIKSISSNYEYCGLSVGGESEIRTHGTFMTEPYCEPIGCFILKKPLISPELQRFFKDNLINPHFYNFASV